MALLPHNHFARALLPAGKIIILPNCSHQRVLLPAEGLVSRWQKSQIYPAFRTSAKLYRFFTRARSTLGLIQTWENPSTTWLLRDFLRDVPLEVDSAVLMIGMPGLAQKYTVQLWNGNQVVAYLKYAEKAIAKVRLENEHQVLFGLPDSLGPKILKYGELLNGNVLLTAAVSGRPLSPKFPPAKILWRFLEACKVSPAMNVNNHPWLQFAQANYGDVILPWMDKLSAKGWPVVLHHGDFTPWNLIQTQDDLQAIDWEYGDLQGFPYLDMIYYILQVAVLMKRWTPKDAKSFAVSYLNRTVPQKLSAAESKALINLAAYHAYRQALENGFTADNWVQKWRQMVWEAKL